MNLAPDQKLSGTPLMSERKVAILCAMLVSVGPISLSLLTPAMPTLVDIFGTSQATVKLAITLYLAGFAVAQLVCGPLSDGLGRKPVAAGFLAIYVLASALALLAPSVEMLLAARFMQGVGAAVGMAIARAVVRDLFTSESSSRIMNLVGMIIGLGPAFSPFIGGLAMGIFGWQAVFVLMLVLGLVIAIVIQVALVETVPRDLSRIRPVELVRSYGVLIRSGYFLASSFVLAGSLGAIYTLATLLPFILMDEVGISAPLFGLAMLSQSISFFAGSLTARPLMARMGAERVVPVGLVFVALGSATCAIWLRVGEASLLSVMVPTAIYSYGIAFIMPAASTAALAPFPRIAGAAASLSGFMQMGGGLIGGLVAMLFTNAVDAMATIVPVMGLLTICFWIWWRMLPEPASARVILQRQPPDAAA